MDEVLDIAYSLLVASHRRFSRTVTANNKWKCIDNGNSRVQHCVYSMKRLNVRKRQKSENKHLSVLVNCFHCVYCIFRLQHKCYRNKYVEQISFLTLIRMFKKRKHIFLYTFWCAFGRLWFYILRKKPSRQLPFGRKMPTQRQYMKKNGPIPKYPFSLKHYAIQHCKTQYMDDERGPQKICKEKNTELEK